MARPIKEGLDYFPMDVNMDSKIQAMESLFKNDGFVWIVKFWQACYRTNDGKISLDSYHGVIHAENCRVTLERHLEMLKIAQEIGLVCKTDDGFYTSNGVIRRIEAVNKERERWRKKHGIELSNEITPVITPKELGKERKRKGNEIKENTEYRPVSLSLLESLKKIGMQPKEDEHTLSAWDNTVRLMVEQDKRVVEQIKQLIEECRLHKGNGDFTWGKNIRSMQTLRERWNENKIWVGMNNTGQKQEPRFLQPVPKEAV